MVSTDDILGPMYSAAGLDGAETRLRQFLIFRFGGHPRPGMCHRHFPIDIHARDRWIMPMNNAFAEAGLLPEAEQPLRDFFLSTPLHSSSTARRLRAFSESP